MDCDFCCSQQKSRSTTLIFYIKTAQIIAELRTIYIIPADALSACTARPSAYVILTTLPLVASTGPVLAHNGMFMGYYATITATAATATIFDIENKLDYLFLYKTLQLCTTRGRTLMADLTFSKHIQCYICKVNIIPADALAANADRASAGIMLT